MVIILIKYYNVMVNLNLTQLSLCLWWESDDVFSNLLQ